MLQFGKMTKPGEIHVDTPPGVLAKHYHTSSNEKEIRFTIRIL